jgi:hypothetical protein
MKISKKDFITLLEQKLTEMPMEFPQNIRINKKNPNFDPNQEVTQDNPKTIPDEVPFNERPHAGIQRKLQAQDTPLKKVPMPTGQGNQNFQEMLASETYREVIKRVKEATGGRGNNLISLMYEAFNEINRIESTHRPELEKLAVESVMELLKIPEGSFNIHAKLIEFGNIATNDFQQPQVDDNNPEPEDVSDTEPETPEIDNEDEVHVEEDYVDKLENFNLERAKRRLLNAMTQGAAHSAYTLYNYVGSKVKNIVGPLPGGKNIMDLYATMMSINDTNYWHMSDEQIVQLQGAVAGKADVKFPQQQNDGGEGMDGGDDDDNDEQGDDDNNEQNNVDTLGHEIDPSLPQIYVYGVNFPVLFHETIKGIQKVIAGHGMAFPGYDASNPRHVDFVEQVKQYEDVLDHEMWDLRLGPAIWQRYRLAHPTEVVDPEQKIELQSWVQSYIYKLPARKFLSLMKEIMEGTPKAKRIIATLVSAIERMFADQDYQEVMSQYEDELDDIDNETTDDELTNLLSGIPGIRLSDDDDDEDYEDDDELFDR